MKIPSQKLNIFMTNGGKEKIIQISSDEYYVYALTDKGNLYRMIQVPMVGTKIKWNKVISIGEEENV